MSEEKKKIDFSNLVPLSEAPKIIPLAEKTLRGYRAKGLYPTLFVKIGGKIFVDLNEFILIIEKQKEKNIQTMRRLGLD